MPEIATARDDLRALRGLHLWHAGLSNCSQRVRLILAEKRLEWTSHLIDLMAFEHATADYQAIHPKGLVPLLLHDGRTITDSNDIILYLDGSFPVPSFGIGIGGAELLKLADDCQLALRTVSHELLLGETRRLDTEALARFGRDHGNREFYHFLHRFSTVGFGDAEVVTYLVQLGLALDLLDIQLARNAFLTGPEMALPDLSWVANVHRLSLIDYPLERLPHVTNWFSRMRMRPSFASAIIAYEMRPPIVSDQLRGRRDRLFEHALANLPNRHTKLYKHL